MLSIQKLNSRARLCQNIKANQPAQQRIIIDNGDWGGGEKKIPFGA